MMKAKTKREASSKSGANGFIELALENVIGNTIRHNASLSCSPTGEIAYPAGCVVVIYDPKLNQQRFLSTDSTKAISCLSFSSNGKYLAAGETGIKGASIFVWEIGAGCSSTPIAQLSGHQIGVACVAFSADAKHIVSVGFKEDNNINLWEWRSAKAIASGKVNAKVFAAAFIDETTNVVTCGVKHVKFWQIKVGAQGGKTRNVLEGRMATLGGQKNSTMTDVVCAKGVVYCVSSNGRVCQFNPTTRVLDNTTSLKAVAFSITASEQYLVCACADGKVRIFDASTGSIRYLCLLPHISPFGFDKTITAAKGVSADAICCRLSSDSSTLTVVYSDRTMCLWNLTDIKHITKSRTLLGHCGPVWDVQFVNAGGALSESQLVSCSADNSIRLWQIPSSSPSSSSASPSSSEQLTSEQSTIPEEDAVIPCAELQNMAYVGDSLSILKQNIFDYERRTSIGDSSKASGGIRCIRVSPDGSQLAAGDALGNIRVYNIADFNAIHFSEAHDAEILSLAYSPKTSDNVPLLLASAGRDSLIHLFDCSKDSYRLVHTMGEHSAAVTSVAFTAPITESSGATAFISCGADKSIIFRSLRWTSLPGATDGQDAPSGIQMERYHKAGSRGTMYGLALHPNAPTAVVAYDKRLQLHYIPTGKKQKTSSGVGGNEDTMQVAFHPQGDIVAATTSERKVWLYSSPSFLPLATASGHSDLVTAVAFSNNRLVTASADGCIFIWRIPYQELESKLRELQVQPAEAQPAIGLAEEATTTTVATADEKTTAPIPSSDNNNDGIIPPIKEAQVAPSTTVSIPCSPSPFEAAQVGNDGDGDSACAFIDMALPQWALSAQPLPSRLPEAVVGGRWAQRIEGEEGGVRLQSDFENDFFANPFDSDDRRFTIEPQGGNGLPAGMAWGEGVAPTGRLSISSRFFAFSGRADTATSTISTTASSTDRPQAHQLRRDSTLPSSTSRSRPSLLPSAGVAIMGDGEPSIPLQQMATVSPVRDNNTSGGVGLSRSPPSPAGESGTEEEEDMNSLTDDLPEEEGGVPEVEGEGEGEGQQWDIYTCRRAMKGLRQMLEINMQLFHTAKDRIATGEGGQEEEELIEEFGRVFASVQSRVEEVCPSTLTTNAMSAPLEKYSELLVQLVQAKLAQT